MEERLQKFLAECGIASRRKCEDIIKSGLITVNDKVVTDMGIKIDSQIDRIKYKGNVVKKDEIKVYIMMNKPVGYVTTTKEQFGRRKVTDLLKGINNRIYPIGRLDYNSSGLLLLTNDGNAAFRLTHPGHEIDKTYLVEVQGIPDKEELQLLRNGVDIGGYVTSPAQVELLSINSNSSTLRIVIHEGKNRQIRRMCESVGHCVIDLKRTAIGDLKLCNLKTGEYRFLTPKEVDYLNTI